MMENINGYCLDLIIHPGETLKEILDDRQMTQNELAIRTGYTPKHVSNIVKGSKGISVNFAKSLENALGIDASFWCNLQTQYEEELHDFKEANNISSEEISILTNLKHVIEYLEQRKIINENTDKPLKIMELRKFLCVNNLTFIPKLSLQGAFRASTANQVDVYVLYAWQKICETQIKNVHLEDSLNIQLLKDSIPQIKRLMFADPNTMRDHLEEIFARCGIGFTIVKHFSGAPVQGFIKKTENGRLILCMTLRKKFADIFWFTLFHEIAHIINGDVKEHFLDFYFTKDISENRADEYARDTLIDPLLFSEFVKKQNFSLEAIKAFASAIEVPYFIVIGRLENEMILDHSMYGSIKTRYTWAN